MQQKDTSPPTPSALPAPAPPARSATLQFAALRETILAMAKQNRDPALRPLIDEAAASCMALEQHFNRLNVAQFAPDNSVDAQVFERLMALAGPATTMELLDQLLVDLESVRHTLVTADPTKDWVILSNQCHVLIAVAGSIGAHGVQNAAENLHAAAVAQNARTAAAMQQKLEARLQSLLSFVRDERQTRCPR